MEQAEKWVLENEALLFEAHLKNRFVWPDPACAWIGLFDLGCWNKIDYGKILQLIKQKIARKHFL